MPWLLGQVARTGSRELFTLSVLATALGIAYGSAELFGVSFALGAFFAGVVLSETDFSHQAAAEFAAAAGRLRGAVLRLGRHAVRPVDPGARAAGGRSPCCWSSCSASRWRRSRIVLAVRLSGGDGAHRLGQPGADRRVLVHPGRPRHRAGPAAAGGPRPDPGRRAAVDHAQSRWSSPRWTASRAGCASIRRSPSGSSAAAATGPVGATRARPTAMRPERARDHRRLRAGRRRRRQGPEEPGPADRRRRAGPPPRRGAARAAASPPSMATPRTSRRAGSGAVPTGRSCW